MGFVGGMNAWKMFLIIQQLPGGRGVGVRGKLSFILTSKHTDRHSGLSGIYLLDITKNSCLILDIIRMTVVLMHWR